jgi:FtsZ-interacting cell division protein ZipA
MENIILGIFNVWMTAGGTASMSEGEMLLLVVLIVALTGLIISVINAMRINSIKRKLEVEISNVHDDMEVSLSKIKRQLDNQTKGIRKEVSRIKTTIHTPNKGENAGKDKQDNKPEQKSETKSNEEKKPFNKKRRPYKPRRKPAPKTENGENSTKPEQKPE